ncbi:MAG: helix-turn-helix transcriptional regulator [Arcicella sp.]|nr:helix-turn-helix transcriptional regulator [Arcicella sp.]
MLSQKKRGSLKPHNSSIVLRLKPILAVRNVTNPATYLIKIGISNNVANKMLKGEAVQLNFRQLTALCTNLNCTPNDLFALRNINLPDNHQLHQLQSIDDIALNPIDYFEGKSLTEIKEILKK